MSIAYDILKTLWSESDVNRIFIYEEMKKRVKNTSILLTIESFDPQLSNLKLLT